MIKKVLYKTFVVLSVLFLLMGCLMCFQNSIAYGEQKIGNADNVNFFFEQGASVRMEAESSGLRFRALIDKDEYNALKSNEEYSSVSFGMIIVPVDMHNSYEINYENVFSENRVYTSNKNETDKTYIINLVSNELVDYGVGEYKSFNGVIINILPQNYVREFLAVSYIKIDTLFDGTKYIFKSVSDSRSVVYVSQLAQEKGTEDSENILNGFVEYARINAKTSDYTVEHYKDGVLAETERLNGVIGTVVTPIAKNYSGYFAPEIEPTEIYANNKTVIKLNYKSDDVITVLNSAQDLANGNMYAYNTNYATLTLSNKTVCGRNGNVFEWTGVSENAKSRNGSIKFSSNIHSELKADRILYVDLLLTEKDTIYFQNTNQNTNYIYNSFNGTTDSGDIYKYYTEYGVECTGSGIWGSSAYLNQWITLEYKLSNDWVASDWSFISLWSTDLYGRTIYISNVRIAKTKPIDLVNETVIEIPDVSGEVAKGEYGYDSGINYYGNSFNIVENGQAKYSIVIPSNASTSVINVANELNTYINKISGATLNIVRDNQTITGNYISIGNTSKLSNTNIDISSLTNDGYNLKTIGGNIYIAGINDRATQYGVYTFMERFMGIRWLNQSYTHIPESSTITVCECDITEQAIFENRIWYGGSSIMTSNAVSYREHSKFYTGEENWCRSVSTNHNTTDYADRDVKGYVNKSDIDPTDSQGRTLGVTHPEYFTDYTNPTTFYDLCFTNGIDESGNLKSGQSVASLMIDKIKSFLTADASAKKINYFMIGIMDDSSAVCKCETCQARRAQYTESGIFVIFMNCIEENINSWLEQTQGRKANFIMFAYSARTSIPPTVKNADGTQSLISDLCKANQNVCVRLAPISADYTYSMTDSKQDKTQFEALEGWKVVSDNLMVWDYQSNYNEYLWYFPNLHYIKENLEYYREIGTTYVMNQSSYTQQGIWFDDIKSYVASKLYWNLDWSVEELTNEYIELYYGEAANTVKKVLKILDNYYAELREKDLLDVDLFASGSFLKPYYYNINLMTTLIDLIEQEEARIQASYTIGSQEKTRIIKALWGVKLTPMTMILRNYSAYYSEEDEKAFAIKYIELCNVLDIKSLGEGSNRKLSELVQKYGILLDNCQDDVYS